MHHIFGLILNDSSVEIIDDETPIKGNFMGLVAMMREGKRMMKQNPKIKQVNIYRVIQGQRILDYQLF